MASRYENRVASINRDDLYYNTFKKRGIRQVTQYRTASLKYPTPEQISNLIVLTHRWTRGDNYTKLADANYGDATYWWVIAHFNQKPLQSEIDFGDVIYIPTPLELVLNYYGV
jgi:nucleoid-associated protein YgaU